MCIKISGGNNSLLSDITFKSKLNLVEEKKTTKVSNNLKQDSKNINQNLTLPIKSEPIKFVDKYQLTKQKIEGASSVSVSVKIAEKALGTTSKIVGNNITKSSTKDVGKILAKSIWVNTSQTVVMSVGEEVVLKGIEKSSVTAAKKGSQELSKRLSSAAPVVGAVIEAGFTIYDAKYAYELSKDKKASFVSKALAWGTVGLDGISLVCTASGVGTPIAWVATGLSVVTAVSSDLLK